MADATTDESECRAQLGAVTDDACQPPRAQMSDTSSSSHEPQQVSEENAQNMEARQKEVEDWKNIVQGWYPDFDSKTYCVPPCIMHRIPYEKCTVNGVLALVTKPFEKQEAAALTTLLQKQKAREKQSRGQAAKRLSVGQQKTQAQKKQQKTKKKPPHESAGEPSSSQVEGKPTQENPKHSSEKGSDFKPEHGQQNLEALLQALPADPDLPLSEDVQKCSPEQPAPKDPLQESHRQRREQLSGRSAEEPDQAAPPNTQTSASESLPFVTSGIRQLSLPSEDATSLKDKSQYASDAVGMPASVRSDQEAPASSQQVKNVLETESPGQKCVQPEQDLSLPRLLQATEQQAKQSRQDDSEQPDVSRTTTVQPAQDLSLPRPLQATEQQAKQPDGNDSEQPDVTGTIPCTMWTRESNPKATPTTIRESDVRDDFAQQHILHCLQKLGDEQEEPMFIISTLDYNNYLNKTCSTEAAKLLPRPVDLPKDYHDGDFDLLIIHRRYGVLIGEIKAVGSEDPKDSTVATKIRDAYKQLNKSEVVVRHILKDLEVELPVRKSLILPNIRKDRLRSVLEKNFDLKKAVCSCMGVGETDLDDALQMCLCEDDLSARETPWLVDASVMSKLQNWWQKRMAIEELDLMSRDVYLGVISRFVGPATTVTIHCVFPPRLEVRTLWEAVSEIGERLARLVLTPQQLELLIAAPRMVCLTGPPGTGKTIMLVMVSLFWLRKGHDVHVFCATPFCYTVSALIKHQLEKTLQADPKTYANAGKVYFHLFDIEKGEEEAQRAVEELASYGQNLHIVMDEVHFGDSVLGGCYQQIITELSKHDPNLCLWAATFFHDVVPLGMQAESLTVPLRTAPVILREVQLVLDEHSDTLQVGNYTRGSTPSPADGPNIIRVRHEVGTHAGCHSNTFNLWPVECFECGLEVGRVLREELRLGDARSVSPPVKRPPPLQYRDVFIITRGKEVEKAIGFDGERVIVRHDGFLDGLRVNDIDVDVVCCTVPRDEATREEMAAMAIASRNAVTFSAWEALQGLERKVIIWLPGRASNEGEDLRDDPNVSFGTRVGDLWRQNEREKMKERLTGFSRCSTQLVLVEVPKEMWF